MNYEPLNGDEIRILHVYPSEDREAEILCDLSHMRLEPLSFSALSYVWAKPEPRRAISIRGQRVFVTPNLFSALQHLRDTTETLHIWVDAICINQQDNLEKNVQVLRMGDIYACAKPVYMWLGEEDEEDDSRLAIQLVQRIDTEPGLRNGASEQELLNYWLLVYLEKSLGRNWVALKKLFERPYWTRVWIVQEIVSTSFGILCCGTSRGNWTPLLGFLTATEKWDLELLPSEIASFTATYGSLQLPLMRIYFELTDQQMQPNSVKMPLLSGLVCLRNRKATDPRDHIYGILGLVNNHGIEPDYNKPASTIYRELVELLIKENGNLDVLSACKSEEFGVYMDVIPCLRDFTIKKEAFLSYLEESKASDTTNSLHLEKSVRFKYILGDFLRSVENLCSSLHIPLPFNNEEASPLGAAGQPDADKLRPDHEEPGIEVLPTPSEKPEQVCGAHSTSSREDFAPSAVDTLSATENQDHDPEASGVLNDSLTTRDFIQYHRDTIDLANGVWEWVKELCLPSWVPDWRVWIKHGRYLLLDKRISCYYNAGRGTPPIVQFSNDGYLMLVDGIFIDTIKVVSPKIDFGDSFEKEIFKEEWKLWSLGDHPRDVYGDEIQQQEAYMHTAVAGRNGDGTKGTSGLTATSCNVFFDAGFLDNSGIDPSTATRGEIGGLMSRDTLSFWLLLKWFRFCTTRQGFMARVPNEVIPGDIIAIFSGAKVPHILRKYKGEDKYFLIGECYVHGLMEGEAFEELDKGARKLETFVLM